MNNKNAFTLIEYIVVIIIISVLAAIALPNLFNNVTRSNGTTALASMDGIKSQLEICAAQQNTTVGSSTCTPTDYGLATTNGFSFSIYSGSTATKTDTSGALQQATGKPSAGNMTYSIIATDVSGNVISLTRSTNNTFTCSAPNAGPYSEVC